MLNEKTTNSVISHEPTSCVIISQDTYLGILGVSVEATLLRSCGLPCLTCKQETKHMHFPCTVDFEAMVQPRPWSGVAVLYSLEA